MLDEPQQELISAYVDGELTPEQLRAAVQLLETSEPARKLSEALRNMQQHVASLPRQTLDDDFAGQVLRACELEILLGGRSPAEANTADPPEVSVSQPTAAEFAAGDRGWRSAIWFVSGAAAAVFLMLLWPSAIGRRPENNTQITQSPVVKDQTGDKSIDKLDGRNEDRSNSGKSANAPKGLGSAGSQPADRPDTDTEPASDFAGSAPAAKQSNPAPPEVAYEVDPNDSAPQLQFSAPATDDAQPAASEEFVLVQVRLTEEAARDQVVQRVLSENGVSLSYAAPEALRPAQQHQRLEEDGRAQSGADRDGAQADSPPESELLLLDSTTTQLAESLRELKQRPGVTADAQAQIPQAYFFRSLPAETTLATTRSSLSGVYAAEGLLKQAPGPSAPAAGLDAASQEKAQPSDQDSPPANVAGLSPSRGIRLRNPKFELNQLLSTAADRQSKPTNDPAPVDESIAQNAGAVAGGGLKEEGRQRRVRSLWMVLVTPDTETPSAATEKAEP